MAAMKMKQEKEAIEQYGRCRWWIEQFESADRRADSPDHVTWMIRLQHQMIAREARQLIGPAADAADAIPPKKEKVKRMPKGDE
jgi:hypothetical protein